MNATLPTRSQDPYDEKAPSISDGIDPSMSMNFNDSRYTAYSNTISEELLISDGEVTHSKVGM